MGDLNYVLISQIASTILLVYLVHKWTYAMYTEYMDTRTKTVNASIDDAIENKAKTEVVLAEVEAEKKDLQARKQEIIAATTMQARAEKEDIINDSKQKARELIDSANKQIESERKAVEGELAQEVMELATLVSEKFLIDQIKNQDIDSLIQQALNEVQNESA